MNKQFALIAEHHPAFHVKTGTPILIKTLCSDPGHPFQCVVAADHMGPDPVPGPWDKIPTLSLFRPRSLFPGLRIGLGLLDPLAFGMQKKRVVRFMKTHGVQRQFVLIANNARLASFAADIPASIPRDVYLIDDFVADSHIYRVNREKAQQVLERLVTESDRVFSISPVYAQDLEAQYGRHCEFLPIPIPDALLEMGDADEKNTKQTSETITLHHAGQIHHLYADALAQLVGLLRKIAAKQEINIRLDLFGNITAEQVEKALKVDLKDVDERSDSHFKIKRWGEVPFEQLTKKQKRADFLLLVNSFLPALEKQIRCSLSSKISEYMLSGVPIIVYAPPYSSLVAHLGKHNAAHVITTDKPGEALQQVERILFHPDPNRTASAALVLAREQHASSVFFNRIAAKK